MKPDIFFISFAEPNAEENYRHLLECANRPVSRLHNVIGIHKAHQACAAFTDQSHFFVVDGDNWVYPNFHFELDFDPEDGHTYVWRCLNVVNGLIYGYGAIKLLPTQKTLEADLHTVDMTTSISDCYHIVDNLVSETRFNTSPFEAFKSAFRECTKLASKVIRDQKDSETKARLEQWCRFNDVAFGEHVLQGALAGSIYGEIAKPHELLLINDFQWLRRVFEENGQ